MPGAVQGPAGSGIGAGVGVVLVHALRNAGLPVITLLGLQLGSLLSGAVITETVFAWPGLGRLAFEAVMSRDFSVLLGILLLGVLTLLAAGMSNQAIAQRLSLSPKTVRNQVSLLLTKLGVRNRTEAAGLAQAAGL